VDICLPCFQISRVQQNGNVLLRIIYSKRYFTLANYCLKNACDSTNVCTSSGYAAQIGLFLYVLHPIKVDCSRHISSPRIHFNKSPCSRHKTRQVGWQVWQTWSIDLPALTANIFAAATCKLTFITRQEVFVINQSIFNKMSMIASPKEAKATASTVVFKPCLHWGSLAR